MNARGLLLIVLAAACAPRETAPPSTGANGKVSEFGRYQGYTEAKYDSWVRTSQYVTARDGTRLAVDVILPAIGGKVADGRFPTLWTHSRYQRGSPMPAAVLASRDVRNVNSKEPPNDSALARRSAPSQVDGNESLQRLVKHGYAVVVVQVRGGGASFGRYEGLFSPAESRDAYDVMDWMTKQPWCDGNLGMFGGSYLGITQYKAASTKHPALKAIFPNVAAFGMYDVIYDGGIYRENMIHHWGILTRSLDVVYPEPPVDADSTGELRAQALKEHEKNWNVLEQFRAARFRDHDTKDYAYARHEPSAVLEQINQSGVAAHHFGGWFDVFARDEMQWLVNYSGSDRVTMGAWAHAWHDSATAVEQGRIISAEQHRWFDRWLKGIDNGVDRDPPINYALMIEPGQWQWKTATQWPLPEAKNTDFFFAGGPSGSARSANDGRLSTAASDPGSDRYLVDLTTTTGTASRWDNAVGQGMMKYPNLADNESKAVTYTTEPLASDLTVVGHPVVRLFVSSDQPDGDFYAVLTEVDSSGFSRYVTEGMLRASHRDTTTAPFNNLGLPWRRHHKADLKPMLPGQVVELLFDLQPTATVFNRGHRLRVTIMGADADNTEKPPVRGRPTITIHRGADHPSAVRLPVVN
ncbi:MAG: CocE/NonD family hydrolase [Gemmatimonadetes bacterium]|nr:CocE/NonD family hydrolase [Gemmatimonadota bacterium]